jgi:hypothetical protein
MAFDAMEALWGVEGYRTRSKRLERVARESGF